MARTIAFLTAVLLLAGAWPAWAEDAWQDESVIRAVAELPWTDLDATPEQPEGLDLSCASIRRSLAPADERRLETWRVLGLVSAERCQEIGAAPPTAAPTTSEMLAERFPQPVVEVAGTEWRFEPYPTGALEPDPWADFPVR